MFKKQRLITTDCTKISITIGSFDSIFYCNFGFSLRKSEESYPTVIIHKHEPSGKYLVVISKAVHPKMLSSICDEPWMFYYYVCSPCGKISNIFMTQNQFGICDINEYKNASTEYLSDKLASESVSGFLIDDINDAANLKCLLLNKFKYVKPASFVEEFTEVREDIFLMANKNYVKQELCQTIKYPIVQILKNTDNNKFLISIDPFIHPCKIDENGTIVKRDINVVLSSKLDCAFDEFYVDSIEEAVEIKGRMIGQILEKYTNPTLDRIEMIQRASNRP